MFECMETMLLQLIDVIPGLIGLFLIFYFIGSLLFDRR